MVIIEFFVPYWVWMLTILILWFSNSHCSSENGNWSLILVYFVLIPGISVLQMIRKSNKVTYYLSDVKLIWSWSPENANSIKMCTVRAEHNRAGSSQFSPVLLTDTHYKQRIAYYYFLLFFSKLSVNKIGVSSWSLMIWK